MNHPRLRIAFLGSEGIPYPNAFAKITEEIGVRLAARGHQVTVYCRAHFVQDASPYHGIQRIVLPSANTKHFDTLSFTLLSVFHMLSRRAADIAHIHGIGPSVLALLPRIGRVKTVVHVHGLDWQRAKWGQVAKACLKIGERTAAYLPSATVVVSKVLQDYYHRKYGRSVCHIPQGVDQAHRHEPHAIRKLGLHGDDYILFMSRLVPEKGCHHLIRAYRQLTTDKRLVIAGGSAHSDDYVHALHTLAASDARIIFTGHVSGALKAELLSNAYLYVLPSEMEGLSLGLLEAMAYGNCVVASNIPENLEALSQFGFTFENGNPGHLRRVIQQLITAPGQVQAVKQQARRHVTSSYSWNVVTDRFEQLYQSLLSQ